MNCIVDFSRGNGGIQNRDVVGGAGRISVGCSKRGIFNFLCAEGMDFFRNDPFDKRVSFNL